MNKFTLLSACLIFFNLGINAQEIMVAGWTFPNQSAESDTGVEVNNEAEVFAMGGTSEIEFKNGLETKAAQVTAWDNGMDVKAWVVEISTANFQNLTISSIQQSGGNDPGPKNFKLQYSIETDIWVDITNGNISVENDWITSAVENLALPIEFENQEVIKIRWVMTSNEASGSGGPVLESGKSKIDNIFIRGALINGINSSESTHILGVYPNPTQGNVTLYSERNIENIQLVSITGQLVKNLNFNAPLINLDLFDLPRGTYFLRTKLKGNVTVEQNKLVLL